MYSQSAALMSGHVSRVHSFDNGTTQSVRSRQSRLRRDRRELITRHNPTERVGVPHVLVDPAVWSHKGDFLVFLPVSAFPTLVLDSLDRQRCNPLHVSRVGLDQRSEELLHLKSRLVIRCERRRGLEWVTRRESVLCTQRNATGDQHAVGETRSGQGRTSVRVPLRSRPRVR